MPGWYVQHKNLDETLLSHSNDFIHPKFGFLEYSLKKYSSPLSHKSGGRGDAAEWIKQEIAL